MYLFDQSPPVKIKETFMFVYRDSMTGHTYLSWDHEDSSISGWNMMQKVNWLWFQLLWKILVKLDHLPQIGVKIKKNETTIQKNEKKHVANITHFITGRILRLSKLTPQHFKESGLSHARNGWQGFRISPETHFDKRPNLKMRPEISYPVWPFRFLVLLLWIKILGSQ